MKATQVSSSKSTPWATTWEKRKTERKADKENWRNAPHQPALLNFFASHTIVMATFPSQNDTLIKQITVPREKDLQECDKAAGR